MTENTKSKKSAKLGHMPVEVENENHGAGMSKQAQVAYGEGEMDKSWAEAAD